MKIEYEKYKKLKEMYELGVPKVQIADKLGITLCAVRKYCEIDENSFLICKIVAEAKWSTIETIF